MAVRCFTAVSRAALSAALGTAALTAAGTAGAQDYAVVQAVPPPASGELSEALRRLARSPSDFDALIAAGKASLALGDIDAAIGFFGRADTVRAGDPRVKAGLASAYLKSDRPIEALQLFDQAQAAGAPPVSLAADRGLAFDLVGDNASAQAQYRLALLAGPDAEVSRRLGLSQAIAGDRKAFEATLLPLLQRRDFAAYRVRAFGLAILGDEQEAVSIAEAVMPRDLSGRITPYLRYMPRLTRPQQAAAANLGAFPRAAQIGREDPRFAQYAGPQQAVPATGADARLAPAGQPLGPRQATTLTRAQQRQAERQAERQVRQQRQTARQPRPTARDIARNAPVRVTRAEPVPAPSVAAATPPPPPPAATPVVQPVPASQAVAVVQPIPNPQIGPAAAAPAPAIVLPQQPVVVARAEPVVSPAATLVGPQIDLPAPAAAVGTAAVVELPAQVALAASPPAAPPPEPASLADAFAEFALAGTTQGPAVGAVDITSIKPKREIAEPAKPVVAKAAPAKPAAKPAPPPKPKAPSRAWVQVATGKDLAALGFDWRRFAKKAPALLGKREAYTAKWGESRRLLTGPFDTPKAAAKMVADLKAAGIDSFTFTSEVGEEVTALK